MEEQLRGKLFEISKSLSIKELRRFGDFISSPFFNKKEKLVKLHSFMLKYHPHYAHPHFTCQRAFAVIFPNERFTKSRLHTCNSELLALLARFLSIEALEQDDSLQTKLYLRALNQKRLDEQHRRQMNKTETLLSQRPQSVDQYYECYEFSRLRYGFEINRRGRIAKTELLLRTIEKLDTYFLADRLRFACTQLNRKVAIADDNFAQKNEQRFLQQLIHYLDERKLDHVPVLKLYFHLYGILAGLAREDLDPTKHYAILKSTFVESIGIVSKAELRQIGTAAISYCNQQNSGGNKTFLAEIFFWYELMLENEVLLVNGYIAPSQHFQNMVIVALKLDKIAWTERFISERRDSLAPLHRERIVTFCLASLRFHKGEYDAADNLLAELYKLGLGEGKDNIRHLVHERLHAKVLYEQGRFVQLSDLVKRNIIYLKRQKSQSRMAEATYTGNQNFLKLLARLQKKASSPSGKGKLGLMKEEVQKLNYVNDREWLIEKIQELSRISLGL